MNAWQESHRLVALGQESEKALQAKIDTYYAWIGVDCNQSEPTHAIALGVAD